MSSEPEKIRKICLIKLGTVELHKASRWLTEDSIHRRTAARSYTRTLPECVVVSQPHTCHNCGFKFDTKV